MKYKRSYVKTGRFPVVIIFVVGGLLIGSCIGCSLFVPDAPVSFSVSLNANNDPELAWISPSGDVDVILIEREKVSRERANDVIEQFNSGFKEIARLEGSTISYIDISAVGGVTYRYRVAAENSAGRSDYTDAYSVTPKSESEFSVRRQGTQSEIPNGGVVHLGNVTFYGQQFFFTIANTGASLLFYSIPTVSPAELTFIIDYYEVEPGETASLLIMPVAGVGFLGPHSVTMSFQTNDLSDGTFSVTFAWEAV